MRDGLVGAGITVLVLVVAAVVLLWSVSDPAGEGATAAPEPGGPTSSPGPSDPPALGDDDLWLTGLELDASAAATPDGDLVDLHAVGDDVRSGPDGVRASTLSVDATVPFDVVARQVGDGAVVGAGPDGLASVTRTVQVAGREVTVVATGSVEAVDGRLVVEPRTVDVGGPDFLAGLLGALARRLVTIEHEIDGLPDGLVLRDVVVQDDGFRAALSGEDVAVTLP